MPSLKFFDEIMIPAGTISINFKGRNPFLVVPMAPKLLKEVMKIPGKDLFETDVRWDVSIDPREFYGQWMGQRHEDRWTTTQIRLIIQGVQNSKDKTGWVTVQFKGKVFTEYRYSNFIQRSFWWAFNYAFYYRQRRQYIEWAKDNIMEIREKMLERLDIFKEA